MARYIGPVCRRCRYIGEKLMLKGDKCATPKCPVERRNVPPGEHSEARRRRISDRGIQLREKQKIRFSYGIMERQFRRFLAGATRATGATPETLLMLLERRLDNVVYHLGFADSRAQARQVVRHGHILVNKHNVDIPSFLIKAGDVIEWRGSSMKTSYYKKVTEEIKGKIIPSWLSVDAERMAGHVLSLPGKDEIGTKFDGKAVVEYYSR